METWGQELEEQAVKEVENGYLTAYHLEPVNREDYERTKETLMSMFADQKEGNIGSVLGGVDIQICLEDHFAEPWPKERPRYE